MSTSTCNSVETAGDVVTDADFVSAITAIGQRTLEINAANGWNVTTPEVFADPNPADKKYTVPSVIAGVHLGLSLALEKYRTRGLDEGEVGRIFDAGSILGDFYGDGLVAELEASPPTNHRVPGILALVHSEVSEALVAYMKQDKANFIEELADTFIRLVDLSHGLGMDLGTAVVEKLIKNSKRGFRHGGKVV